MSRTELMIFALLSMFVTAVNGYGNMVGGQTMINDAKTNKGVQGLGKFAVEEYNKSLQQKGKGDNYLVFSQVLEASKQIVTGIKYFLKVEATENGEKKMFDAVVLIKPWAQTEEKEMLSFTAANQ
ncbi:hypothetical protein HRI_000853100 [Hibiscus trionum]|uniref:Cystatin domain-containing protein n=1 Tax=Hibiscus trionum TaxID=183268 RepID=A0A9W7LPA0_HIBTR|nr:hypothetical protein HRI_000853100 [Hibiscus trionum]